MPDHYGKNKLGGMAGKAEKSLGGRRRRIDEMEDEATKAMPEPMEADVEPMAPRRAPRKINGWPWD